MTKDRHTGWLALGVRAYDADTGRVGVVQLLRDDAGTLSGGAYTVERPGRVLLRPVVRREADVPWWAHAANLRHPESRW